MTAFIHPDDVEGIVEEWRASLASGEPFLHEARVLRADGEYRWMLHRKVAVRVGCGEIVKWYGSSIDIEDRKRRKAKSAKKKQSFSRLDLTPQHLAVLAPLGKPLYGNRAPLRESGGQEYPIDRQEDTGPVAILMTGPAIFVSCRT